MEMRPEFVEASSVGLPVHERNKRDFTPWRMVLREEGGLADVDAIADRVLERLALLDRLTPVIDDERRAVGYAERVFAHFPELGDRDHEAINAATLLTDIGKSGPKHATLEQQELIAAMYNVEKLGADPERITVAEFFELHKKKIPQDAQPSDLNNLHVTGEMTMRQFYNLHSGWTFDLLKGSGVPNDVIVTASAHHFLEAVDAGIYDPEHNLKQLGVERPVGTREILVILLDKYDACLHRSKLTHEQAISYLCDKVNAASWLKRKPDVSAQFLRAIDTLDEVLGERAPALH